MQKFKLNDEIIVIAGKEKGKRGKITKLFPKQNRVLVQGVNMVKKSIRPTQENPNGGISEKEASLHISNVAIYSPKAKKASRVKIEFKDGKRIRVAKACGTILP